MAIAQEPELNTTGAQVRLSDIWEALRTSCEVFLDFFLHEDLIYAVPAFHVRIWTLMTRLDLKRIAIAVPRGHAKTTLAKLACVWYFLFTDVKFIVYLSATSDAAIKAVGDIIAFMETNNFIKVFGAIRFEMDRRGEGEFHFILRSPFFGEKRCILKARGAGQQVRGLNINNRRPEVAIVDDIEDAEALDTPEAQAKLDKWFFGTFLKAMDRRNNKVIFIGNMVSSNCLLKRLIENPRWYSMHLGSIQADGSPLWDDLWPVEELIEDYKEYVSMGQTSLWFAEMMNLIIAGDDALIKPEDIYALAQGDPEYMQGIFIIIDPATGAGKDDTAVTVHALIGVDEYNVVPQVVDYRFGKIDEAGTVDVALELAFKWGCRVIAVEAVAYQRALATMIKLRLAQLGIVDIEVIKTYPGNSSKLQRIRAWCGLLKQKAYAICTGDVHIIMQLLAFNVKRKDNRDDLIDACAMGPQVLQEYYGLIIAKRQAVVINSAPTRAAELC